MKKFAKMLALGLALAMTFGMAVSAAENDSVITQKPTEAVEGDVTDYTPDAEEVEEVVTAANAIVKNPSLVFIPNYKKVEVKGTFFWNKPEDADSVEVALTLEKLEGNWSYSLLHVNEDGIVDQVIDLVEKDGKYTATLTKFSPYILVAKEYTPGPAASKPAANTTTNAAPVSPKTGETLPVAGMMAVLCLAGALVCAKKARCNN